MPFLGNTSGATAVTADLGVVKHVEVVGEGELPLLHSRCFVHYTGYLAKDESQFVSTREDPGEPVQAVAGRVLCNPKGLFLGIASMRKGETCTLYLTPEYGYGNEGHFSFPHVPCNSHLVYRVTLIEWLPPDEEKQRIEMFFEERLEAAVRRKDAGNKLHASQKYEEAVEVYEIGLSFMNEDFLFQLEQVHLEQANKIRIPLLLNVSACLLKLSKYAEAINYADQILHADSSNVKALFRKGKSMRLLGQSKEAKEWLLKALHLEKQNKSIKEELKLIKEDEREMYEAEKKLFGGKLEKPGHGEDSSRGFLGGLADYFFKGKKCKK